MGWPFGYFESVLREADCLEGFVDLSLQKRTQMIRQTIAFPLGLVQQRHASLQTVAHRQKLSCPLSHLPAPVGTWT